MVWRTLLEHHPPGCSSTAASEGGSGSAHHPALGSSLTVLLVLVLLLFHILVFAPVLGLVLVLVFIWILAEGFVYGSVLFRSTIPDLFLLFGTGASFGARSDSDFCTLLLPLTFCFGFWFCFFLVGILIFKKSLFWFCFLGLVLVLCVVEVNDYILSLVLALFLRPGFGSGTSFHPASYLFFQF